MLEKIKAYCEHEVMGVEKWGYDPNQAVTRCFGAVVFLLDFYKEDVEGLEEWWDNVMHPKFRELQSRG